MTSAYRLTDVLVLFIMNIFVLIESIDFVDFFNISEYDTIESLTNTDFSSNFFISEMSLLCLFKKVSIILI